MSYYARIDSSGNIREVLHISAVDDLVRMPLESGDAFYPMTPSEFASFTENQNARYVDNVFTVTEFKEPPVVRDIDEYRSERLAELNRVTFVFIASLNGQPRYSREKQSTLLALSSRYERKIRLSTLPDDVKAFLAGTSNISPARVNAWILDFMDRNEVSEDLRDQYATIKAQYQAGTLTLKQLAEWSKAVWADVMEQHESKLNQIESAFKWIDSVLDAHYAYRAAIETATTVEELDAITFDFSSLNATDPGVWLEHVI